jgi:ABC-2 type transport system ATP-binding protein
MVGFERYQSIAERMPMSTDYDHSIVVDSLSHFYGDFQALDDVSFTVDKGEILGFLGPNGAGKTTVMEILTCYMGATRGDAKVAGFDVYEDFDEVRKRVGYLPENVPLYDDMLVYDYLTFVSQVRNVPPEQIDSRIRRVSSRVGLDNVIHRSIHELSKGYRQRVGLAQAIIHEPEVLILDEPTTGLDPNQIVEIRDVIKEIGEEKTIIFSTHILQEVTAVCDRIVIINQGEIVADGSLDELEDAVAQTEPGLVVEYESADLDGVRGELNSLEGVDEIQQIQIRPGRTGLRIHTEDEQHVRKRLLEDESQNQRGLSSLQRAQPTLEDIFRVYTEGTTEESSSKAS